MPTVIAVRFRHNPKQLWFDPGDIAIAEGDHVIVQTDRGTEIALACTDLFEASDKEIKALSSGLKPVIRVATEEDLVLADELATKNEEAMPIFRELIEKHELDMKPVRVDFLFGGEKAIFYFASEERIDFRDLVRDLASQFHTRVDMRQIGVRDEARLIGGYAHCGQELCCARLGGEFQPVSIRMAKEQDLPLNPAKISGVCGRLMCCLRYEFEAYKDFKSRAPKSGATIETPLGLAKVTELDTPREVITLRLEDGKLIHVPLDKMECAKDDEGNPTGRPCMVSQKSLDEIGIAKNETLLSLGVQDRNLEDGVVETNHDARKPRRRSSGNDTAVSDKGEGEQAEEAKSGGHRKRRRGKGSSGGDEGKAKEPQQQKAKPSKESQPKAQGNPSSKSKQPKAKGSAQATNPRKRTDASRPRPGQNSSGVRSAAARESAQSGSKEHSSTGNATGQASRRAAPRRRHPGNSQGENRASGDTKE